MLHPPSQSGKYQHGYSCLRLQQRPTLRTRRLRQPLSQGLHPVHRLVEFAHKCQEFSVYVVIGPGHQLRLVAREELEDKPQFLHDSVVLDRCSIHRSEEPYHLLWLDRVRWCGVAS